MLKRRKKITNNNNNFKLLCNDNLFEIFRFFHLNKLLKLRLISKTFRYVIDKRNLNFLLTNRTVKNKIKLLQSEVYDKCGCCDGLVNKSYKGCDLCTTKNCNKCGFIICATCAIDDDNFVCGICDNLYCKDCMTCSKLCCIGCNEDYNEEYLGIIIIFLLNINL